VKNLAGEPNRRHFGTKLKDSLRKMDHSHVAEEQRESPGEDSRFSCNICLESVSDEPVLTLCGHVYCWHCLYMWLKPGLTAAEQAELGIPTTARTSDASRRVCPTCKAPCSVRRVIPIYVRSETTPAGGTSSAEEEKSAETLQVDPSESLRRRNVSAGTEDGTLRVPSVHHRRMDDTIPRRPITRLAERSEVRLGLSPTLYASASLSHGMFPLVQPLMHDTPADEGATEYLSRLLLLLGSFVILCLLVFP
jgi:zinc-RING finger domain